MDNLQWGQPWNFFFNPGLDDSARNKRMNDIAANLYSYVEKSLGGHQFFTLQISWSFSPYVANLYQMNANLVVNQAGVVSWQQKNEKKNKEVNLRNQTEAAFGINDRAGEVALGGSKPPPPPPPPPPIEDILGMEPPFKLFINIFLPSHVLEFNAHGEVQKFNESPLKIAGGAIA